MPPPPPTVESKAADSRADTAALGAGRLRAAARLAAKPEAAVAAGVAACLAASTYLLLRLVPDVSGKPLFGDEVVAGLTATHSLRELLDIVLFDRGGAPLHFVLSHLALSVHASPEALRSLSVVFALATIPVCFDIGRRLGGTTAGAVAAIVVATSSMLAVYGSVGRMYALFAFVSALAIDLFLVALERRTAGSALAAAGAAWFLPAVHPYGLVVAGIMALVALGVWRGRPLVPALPVLGLAVATTPFVVADLRLGERFGVGSGPESVAPADFAARQLGEALAAFAGGAGVLSLFFFGLAVAGLLTVARSRPPVAVLALCVLASVPLLMVVARAESAIVHQLSPRHLMFGLPVWAALVGVGVARLVREAPYGVPAVAVAAVAVAAAFAPAGIADPREPGPASRAALAAPAAWVGERMEAGSVLLFYSPVYLEGIGDARAGTAIPRSGKPLRMVERASYPVPSVVGTLTLSGTTVRKKRLEAVLGPGSAVETFPGWLTYSVPGPFADPHAVLVAARDALVAARDTSTGRTLPFRRDVRGGIVIVCDALAELGDPCSTTVLPR